MGQEAEALTGASPAARGSAGDERNREGVDAVASCAECGEWIGLDATPGAVCHKCARIDELVAAIIRMHRAVPGGTTCDPQAVADELRQIAASVGVDVEEQWTNTTAWTDPNATWTNSRAKR